MSAFMVAPSLSRSRLFSSWGVGARARRLGHSKANGAESIPSAVGRRALGNLGQELGVGLGGADPVHEQLEPWGPVAVGRQGVQHPAQLPHLLELAPLEEELLVAGRAGIH